MLSAGRTLRCKKNTLLLDENDQIRITPPWGADYFHITCYSLLIPNRDVCCAKFSKITLDKTAAVSRTSPDVFT